MAENQTIINVDLLQHQHGVRVRNKKTGKTAFFSGFIGEHLTPGEEENLGHTSQPEPSYISVVFDKADLRNPDINPADSPDRATHWDIEDVEFVND